MEEDDKLDKSMLKITRNVHCLDSLYPSSLNQNKDRADASHNIYLPKITCLELAYFLFSLLAWASWSVLVARPSRTVLVTWLGSAEARRC